MVTSRRNRYLGAQLTMLFAVAIVLTLMGVFSYDLFFFLSLVGFMFITDLTTPFKVVPAWHRGLKWVVVAGLLVFGGLVVVRTVLLILETM